MTRIGPVGIVCLVFMVLGGISSALKPRFQFNPAPTAQVGSAATPASDAGPPVTEAEAKKFAKELERALNTGDLPTLIRHLHLEEFVTRCVADLNLSPDDFQALHQAFQDRGGAQTLVSALVTGQSSNGFRVLRVYQNQDRWGVVVRQLDKSGLSYLEFKLFRHPTDGVGIEDIYLAAAGDWLSVQFRSFMITGYQKAHRHGTRAVLAEIEQTERFQAAVSAGDHEAVYQQYRTLPDTWKFLRSTRVMTMAALSNLPNRRLDLATEMKGYREAMGGEMDSALATLAIHFYHSKEDLPRFREAVAFLNRWTGGDPHLSVLEGQYLLRLKRDAEGLRLIERAVKADPTLEEGHLELITDALVKDDNRLTLTRLQAMVVACRNADEYRDLTEQELFATFVRTPEYQQYLTWVAKRVKK
jgi:hypothetical protein